MADATQDDAQTGVVVVALPAADDPVQAIGPEQKHATLLYFGDVEGGSNPNQRMIDDTGFELLLRTCVAIVAVEVAPFTADVSAVEPLGDGGAQVWMLDTEILGAWREEILDVDHELASALEAVDQYPTCTAHVTIGYEPGSDLGQGDSDAPLADGDLDAASEVTSITFDRLAVWFAGEQYEYPLTGVAESERPSRPGGPMPKQIREHGRLLEVTAGGTAGAVRRPIQIITPGWGSSGYYSADVLERAAANRVIPKGTHMYLNHASESERSDRPEREVEKIAAVLVEDARWDGSRLLANADLMGPHAELIEAVAPYIGVSISGSATDITIGEAEGRRGPIIEDLAHVQSVDFVTHAGRGGMVLLESARPSLVNALAVEHGIAEATANETRELLSQALREMFPGEKVWVWVRDFDDTTVWYEHETPEDCGTYSLAYSIADNGVVTLSGSPVEVRAETNYVPVPPGGTTRTEEATPMGEEQTGQTGDTSTTEAAAAATETQTTEATTAAAAAQTASGTEPAAGTTPTPSPTEENDMTDTTQGAGGTAPAQEAATPPATNPRQVMEARLNEQGRQIRLLRAGQQAQSVVGRILAEGWVADATKVRLTRELTAEATLPLTEAGELDEAALQVRATEQLHAAETEAAETMSAFGFGKVRGLGATESTFTPEGGQSANPYADSLAESFKVLGLSESAVDTATKGR